MAQGELFYTRKCEWPSIAFFSFFSLRISLFSPSSPLSHTVHTYYTTWCKRGLSPWKWLPPLKVMFPSSPPSRPWVAQRMVYVMIYLQYYLYVQYQGSWWWTERRPFASLPLSLFLSQEKEGKIAGRLVMIWSTTLTRCLRIYLSIDQAHTVSSTCVQQ